MTPANILKVIDNLKKVLPMAEHADHLNMGECGVKDPHHKCGTVHCHGGWYAVATCNLRKKFIDYSEGAEKLAKHLGFKSDTELERYMDKHPDVWGNRAGAFMFYEKEAFYHETKRPHGAITLRDIIDHWQDVYERVKEDA